MLTSLCLSIYTHHKYPMPYRQYVALRGLVYYPTVLSLCSAKPGLTRKVFADATLERC